MNSITGNLFFSSQAQFLALAILFVVVYGSHNIIGKATFFLMLGAYFTDAVLADMPELIRFALSNETTYYTAGSGVIWLPMLLMILIIYETEGTMYAHRLFLGLSFLYIFFLVISILFANTYNVPSFTVQMLIADQGDKILLRGIDRISITNTAQHILLLFLLPVIHQTLRNKKWPMFFCFFAALCTYTVANESLTKVIYQQLVKIPEVFPFDNAKLWAYRLFTTTLYSLLGHCFFKLTRKPNEVPAIRSNFAIFSELRNYFHSVSQMRQDVNAWADRFNLVMEHSQSLICILNQEGKIQNANPKVLGYLDTEEDENNLFFWNFITTENEETIHWRQIWERLLDSSNPEHVITFRNLRFTTKDKQVMFLDLSLSIITSHNQSLALLIANDVTERRQEEQLKLDNAEMMMHSQRLESIGLLAGGIAHEFNNLLQSGQASLDIITQHHQMSPTDTKLLENINLVHQRCANLTTQLLGYARKGKRLEIPLEIQKLLEQTTTLFGPTAKGIKLKTICPPEPLIVLGDDKQLSQVILNLLINAKDACANVNDPSIVIRAEIASEELAGWQDCPVDYAIPQDYVCLQVRDNGCGMTEEVQKKIFEPFFTTKGPGSGTGMGLAMVYGTIIQHRGWLKVISAVNSGTNFQIFLPVAKP